MVQPQENVYSEEVYRKIMDKALDISFFEFVNRFELQNIYLNEYIREDIKNRCIKDFERISKHHSSVIKCPDVHKIAGTLTYWICRLRPLIVQNDYYYNNNTFSYCIEIFAIMSGCIVINMGRHERKEKLIGIEELHDILADFLYILKYCNQNSDILSIIYYYLDSKKIEKSCMV